VIDTIQGFFFGTSYNEYENGKPVGLTGFAIPDLGIIYRSRHEGSIYECQYAGLLALLKFIDMNKKSFNGLEFEILSDSALIVYQISHRKFISRDLAPLYSEAIEYKKKVQYRVSWVPREENIAIMGMSGTPALRPDLDIDFTFPSGDSIGLA
jgi:hypothetical protein